MKKRFTIHAQRIRRDFAILTVEAESIEQARRKALKTLRADPERFCDGRKPTVQVKQCYEIA